MTEELLKEIFDKYMIAHNALVRRAFIIIIVLIILLFSSNVAWLYVYNLPNYETSESYELNGEDSANVIYNSDGDVRLNDGE